MLNLEMCNSVLDAKSGSIFNHNLYGEGGTLSKYKWLDDSLFLYDELDYSFDDASMKPIFVKTDSVLTNLIDFPSDYKKHYFVD